MNLLKETIGILKENNKTLDDIEWIGTSMYFVDKDKALKLFDVEYDRGYGGQEVAINLLVVGKDWWLERHEYDGSEWWEMKTMPIKPKNELNITRVTQGSWTTLESLNRGEL